MSQLGLKDRLLSKRLTNCLFRKQSFGKISNLIFYINRVVIDRVSHESMFVMYSYSKDELDLCYHDDLKYLPQSDYLLVMNLTDFLYNRYRYTSGFALMSKYTLLRDLDRMFSDYVEEYFTSFTQNKMGDISRSQEMQYKQIQ